MNTSKKIKRVISMVLVLLIACSNLAFGKGLDYEGHRSEFSIKELINRGYVKGYVDGNFKPDHYITRAELIALVNRSYGFTEEADITYTDVKESHWAYTEFKRAKAAGYITGFEDGTLRPNNKVTRQELAVIIARALKLEEEPTNDKLHRFNDVSTIPAWSKGAVGAVVGRVYMDAYMDMRGGNIFAPTLPATRGEVAGTVYFGLSSLVHVVDVTYSETPRSDEAQATTKGTLAVSLSDAPFSMAIEIIRTINGKEDKSFQWREDTIKSMDRSAKVFTIDEIKPVEATEIEQIVVYTVLYGGSEFYSPTVATKSNEIIVGAKK